MTVHEWMATDPRIHARRIALETIREYLLGQDMAGFRVRWMLGVSQSPGESRVMTTEGGA